jgi:hypothetical protein
MAETNTKPTIASRADFENLLASLENRDPGEVIREICRFADTVGDDSCEALLASNPELFKYATALTNAHHKCLLDDEANESARLLQHRPNGPVVISNLLGAGERRVYGRVEDMFQNINFSKCNRLVMVGCGPCPSTIFHLCERTEIPEIIGLDVLPQVIGTVRALIRQFGLSRVRVEISDGREFDYDSVDVVFVANLVSPKGDVLSRIADTAPVDVQIVARDPYSLGRLWAESGERNLDPRLEVIGRGRGSYKRSRDVYIKRRIREL